MTTKKNLVVALVETDENLKSDPARSCLFPREGIQMCSEINNHGGGMDLPDNMLFYLLDFFFFFDLRLNITGEKMEVIQVDHLSIFN